jgi:transposase
MRFCGIDLHSNNCVVVVTDATDRVLLRERCANDLATVLRLLAPHQAALTAVAVESTYNWYWLVDGLMAAGYAVQLANTAGLPRYDGLKHRDDVADAAHLAQLLRLGLLPTGHIMPPAERALRDLARKRMQLVRTRTQQVLAVENILARTLGRRVSSAAVKRLTVAEVAALGLAADVALAVQANVAVIRTLTEQVAALEQRLVAGVAQRPEYALLRSIPGIGTVLAIVILLETGDIGRFAAVGHYASYARCVASAYTSNGKKKGAGNTRNGNPYLVWAFIEAANLARRYCTEAQRFFARKQAKTNRVVATKALAHKLARASYHVLKAQQPFDVQRCFA